MNKENFLRVYTNLQVAIGLLSFLFVSIFAGQIPKFTMGTLHPSFFALKIEEYQGFYQVLNVPLLIFISLFLLNIFMIIRVGSTKEVQKKYLQNVVLYNILLSLMMMVGHVAFLLMLPETVAGEMTNRFIMFTIHVRSGVDVNVVYLGYILSIVYFVYNAFVAYQSRVIIQPETEVIYDVNNIKEIKEEDKQ